MRKTDKNDILKTCRDVAMQRPYNNMDNMQKLLFVCSRNKRRSLTAETIFKKSENFDAKSCGTSPQARIKINEKLINWADVVLVMEKRHKEMIMQQFSEALKNKTIITLFIPDEYEYMNQELIAILMDKTESL